MTNPLIEKLSSLCGDVGQGNITKVVSKFSSASGMLTSMEASDWLFGPGSSNHELVYIDCDAADGSRRSLAVLGNGVNRHVNADAIVALLTLRGDLLALVSAVIEAVDVMKFDNGNDAHFIPGDQGDDLIQATGKIKKAIARLSLGFSEPDDFGSQDGGIDSFAVAN